MNEAPTMARGAHHGAAALLSDEDMEAMPEAERVDFDLFKSRVLRRTGIDLNAYRHHQMYRRLSSLLDRANVRTFAQYADKMERDPATQAAFLDRLTINVSELFRNPDRWAELTDRILPDLIAHAAREGRSLRIWSAGCSSGAEPYTLAMILAAAGVRGAEIRATDIDAGALRAARAGRFRESEVKCVPDSFRRRFLTRYGADYEVIASMKAAVAFERHNMLADPFPGDLDLIVCRNVVIYFTDAARHELFRKMAAALRPGGVLFVGGTERIFDAREIGIESPIPFFYRKLDRAV